MPNMCIHRFFESLPFQPLLVLIPLLFLSFFLYKHWVPNKSVVKRLPSPPKLPILGNLHQLSKLPHRSLRSLSERYGELMFVQMGSKPSLVVSSANAAREVMKTHDLIFANRPKLKNAAKLVYDCKDVTFSPYGEYWRQIKSICVVQLLSNKKIPSFRSIREEEIALLVEKLKRSSCSSNSVVNLSGLIKMVTSDAICRALFGRKYAAKDETGTDIVAVLMDFMELLGVSSMGDVIPWLGWIDRVNGLSSRVDKVAKYLDEFLEGVVQEHRDHQNTKRCSDDGEDENGENVKDFVDILLEIQRENKKALSNDSIKALILDMFAGGMDTIYTLLEWVTTELLRHPMYMKKLQEEVRETVRGKIKVTEDDLHKMEYLTAVIKETLRLHPPAPLLALRETSQDVKINGYDIAAKTQVIINAWAIQRDPTFWEDPEEFRPERFLNSLVDLKGQNFHFIPFGSGRRGCPGISFALIYAQLILATLMYEFDWKIPVGAECKTLDVSETAGLTVRKRDPLLLIATPCSH